EAIGGEALLQLNTELQYHFSRYFRGFLFYDRGNVYGGDDKRNNTTDKLYDLEQMRHSWGFGVHFFSPVGPISLAYGFKLDQRTGETPSEFHFTIGGAF
ncbi:MAG: BamA/TamA family outer membrane protein, partial [Nitrospinae bacterium]|nr:BamA/TamA family outer membrane protein [Nitrospinota bacterium]